jgi:hypothetical protein
MTWTAQEQRDVANALLGSWPGTIAAWGKEAFAAYLGELEARGLDAIQVLTAIRTWPSGSDFPPSAPNLAAAAIHDPSRPTFDEAFALIYGRGGVLRARPADSTFADAAERDRAYLQAARQRAAQLHPLIGPFVERFGIDRLRALEVDHDEYGDLKRRELRQHWEQFVEATEHRRVAAIASPRREEGLARLDPLAALGVRPAGELETGSSE